MARILVLHHAPFLGGGSTSFIDLLLMLRNDHEVVACCPAEPSDVAGLVAAHGIELVESSLPFPSFNHYNGGPSLVGRSFWQDLAREPVYRRRWQRLIASVRPDIVVVNSSVLVSMGPAIAAAGAKAVCVIRETLPDPSVSLRSRIMYRMLTRWFAGVVFISKFDRDQADGYLAAVSAVVRDCVRPDAFRRLPRDAACAELGVPRDTYNVLFSGGASWFKGLDVALEAFTHMGDANLRLIVAGYPQVASRMAKNLVRMAISPKLIRFDRRVKQLLQEESIAGRVVFVGAQSDMSACYSLADVVVFPATVPHQSRPLFEASFYGLPVICTNYEQYLEHLSDMLPVRGGDSSGLAATLLALESDRHRGMLVGQHNRALAAQMHDFPSETARLLAFIAEI